MEIGRERRLKDDFLRNDHGSPIPHEERNALDGLKYYSVDVRYRFRLHLQRYATPETVAMTAADGRELVGR